MRQRSPVSRTRHGRLAGRSVATLIVASVVGWACGHGSALRQPAFAPQTTADLVPVPYPPPPAVAEVIPPAPSEQVVWVDGEWVWQSRRWAWRRGRWVAPPPNARFSPWTLVWDNAGTLYFAPGAWRGDDGGVVALPEPVVAARLERATIVDPNGVPIPGAAGARPARSRRARSSRWDGGVRDLREPALENLFDAGAFANDDARESVDEPADGSTRPDGGP